MENFTFYNPTRIEFGKEKEKEIGNFLAESDIKKVLIIYGSDRIKNSGLFDEVANSLKDKNIEFVEFGGIVSNPLLSKVYDGIEVAKANQVEAILSIGGGSVLDSSKAIATGSLYDGDVWDFFTWKSQITKALPIFNIMTLSASGSEMNSFAVVTNDETKEKISIMSPLINPKVSIINPELMKTISKEYLVYSATDIIAHSLEGYLTGTVQPNLINRQVESVIKTVIETTEILIENPENYEARGELAWASILALNGLNYVGTAGFSYPNHMIEYGISALYNVPHGAGLSVVIPAWMKWYCKNNEKQFTKFAKEIFNKDTAKEGIEALENWFNKIGTPTRLSQLNIYESALDEIVEAGLIHAKYFGLSEIYTSEVLKEIIQKAL